MHPLTAHDVVDGYEILGPLGHGGFGTTYKARELDGDRLVVLKFPEVSLLGDPAVFERFQREFAVGQRLSHPAIPRALATGNSSAGPYLALEYVEGISLRMYLEEHAPLSVYEALSIAKQLAEALIHAHAAGVFHRDLKPENVIRSPDGSVHIVDFGTALMEGARRITWRMLSSTVGTPDYMAPEQIQGKRGDARTDIYALGIMLYDMLTGTPPFRGDNPLAVMNQHITQPPPPPHALNPSIPPPVEGIILKSIRKAPNERYQSADSLLQDLEHYQDLDLTQFAFAKEHGGAFLVPDSPRTLLLLGVGGFAGFLVALLLITVVTLMVRGR